MHVYLEQWLDAKQCFLNAVAANPNHTEALRALGETHLMLGEPRLAEKMLKDAAKLDPNCPKIWQAYRNPIISTISNSILYLIGFLLDKSCKRWAISMLRLIVLLPRCSWNRRVRCFRLPRYL